MKIKGAVIVFVLLIISFVLLLSDRGSARLDTVIRNAIIIAYMNGYADALELKTDEINELKKDEKLLHQRVTQAAADYIITVESMNE